jgi:hypothetical protein
VIREPSCLSIETAKSIARSASSSRRHTIHRRMEASSTTRPNGGPLTPT